MDGNGPARLNGWKEIANHLGVTVRTAQLWEKHRGLPIHRLPGGGKPSVFSTTEELEAWIHCNPDRPAPETRPTDGRHAPSSGQLRIVAIVATLVVISILAIIQIPSDPSTLVAEVATCSVEGQNVKALDATGGVIWLWSYEDMGEVDREERSDRPECIVQDVNADGRSEVLFLYLGNDRYRNDARLICKTPGETRSLWEHPLGRRLEKNGRVFSAAYIGRLVRPVEIRGTLHLIVVTRHSPSYPSEIVLLDARSGALVDRYSHPGHLENIALGDLDLDGTNELLVGGINNPGPGPGRPVLILLDLPFTSEHGRSRRSEDFFGNPGPQELLYLSLPRSDADEAAGLPAEVREVGISDEGVVTAVVVSPNGRLTYTLDLSDMRHPRITSATAQTSFKLGHDALTDAGKLDHYLPTELPGPFYELTAFDTAPDGNAL
jgi:hypothetical protein